MWREIVASLPHLVWVAEHDGRVVFYNERVREYDGIERASDGSWTWAPVLHADDVEPTAAAWRRAVATGEVYEAEHRVRMADGRYRWHLSRAVPRRDDDGRTTWFGTATDIHDRVLAEQRARSSEARVGRMIDGLFTFVGLCAPDGTLLEANATALGAAGLDRDEVVGRPFWDAYWWSHDPAVQERLRRAVDRAREGETSRYDVPVRVAGGRMITIDFQLVPLVEQGRVTALVPSALDITDRIAERDRLVALARLSAALNEAASTTDVVSTIVDHVPGVVAADLVSVGLLDADTGRLRVGGPALDASPWWPSLEGDERTPFHDALERGEMVLVDRAVRATAYPHLVADAERAGLDTTVSLPLLRADGSPLGVLGVAWSAATEIDPGLASRLRVVANLCAPALDRSRSGDRRDRLVTELQDRLLADHADVDHLDVAVGYRPAESAVGFGGDWYDVVAVSDRVTAAVVGDVVGHGIAAAAEMAIAKATVRSMVLTSPPSRAMADASRALADRGHGYVATAAVAWIDHVADRVVWSSAGHPPPVLKAPDGSTRFLTGRPLPPLGRPDAGAGDRAAEFPPGSVLVLYTDGLVERRDRDIDVGLRALREGVEALPDTCTAAQALDLILRGLLGGPPGDDVALVVVRHAAPVRPHR